VDVCGLCFVLDSIGVEAHRDLADLIKKRRTCKVTSTDIHGWYEKAVAVVHVVRLQVP
jgi:hypothetical protein